MAQSISLWGATYSDVPGVLLPKSTSGTALFADPSITTAVAADVAQGKQFLLADGSIGTGTATGGGGSSWTKVCEKSYTRSTTSTTAATVETWSTTHSEIWTPNKYVFVRVRDTAGKRTGYFYGCDCFFMNDSAMTSGATTCTNMGGSCYYYATGIGHRYIYNTTGYGIYADYIYSDGRVRIRERYHSTYSKTIDGTYKVEVYLLDPPSPIFG